MIPPNALQLGRQSCLSYERYDYGPGSLYSWAECRLADPLPGSGGQQHVIQSPYIGDERFAAYAYGQDYAAAYAYPTGYGF